MHQPIREISAGKLAWFTADHHPPMYSKCRIEGLPGKAISQYSPVRVKTVGRQYYAAP